MKNLMRVADTNFDKFQAKQGVTTKNASQMEKLVGILQMGVKAGPDDAQRLAKMEARVVGLTDLKKSLQKATLAVSELYLEDKSKQLKKLTASMKLIRELSANKPPIGVKKHLQACMNELTSLREGVFIGAATKKTLTIVACSQALNEVDALLSTTKARVKAAKSVETAATDDDLYSDDIEKVIQQNSDEARNLDSLANRPFVVARVPIIPISNSGLSAEQLKRKGFKVETISNYVVMHKQLVIGINKSTLNLKRNKEGGSIDPKKWRDSAMKIVKLLEKELKTHIHLVDDKPYGYKGGAWFWVMTDKDLSSFATCFPGKHVKLERFGFAF